MVPVPITSRHSSRLLYIILSAVSNYVPRLVFRSDAAPASLAKRDSEFNPHKASSIVFVVLIPILVLSSGLFAGLTLGYMSLDETQLNVLSISGTPDQRKYANKIMPIRKNGHLLLVTLLLANMIVNESLPVIADPILGGGVQSVVVSTVLIVIFAEIIPQSLFTRHGLYLGAKLAGFTKILIYVMGVIAWPVAKLLEFVLGSHHGIIYRRAELKELIAMHSSQATHGGDLKTDTVTIIGATLDLQEKVVRQAMTPIKDVFMLSIESKLDYALLKKICQTGHSRVPVYEEVDVPASVIAQIDNTGTRTEAPTERTQKVKKIIGMLLVKQCVLLDPKDATPLRKIPLNKVPFVPNNEPLLGILDRFQEGRSHMAIVSRFSVDKAASVKKAVKMGLTQRLRKRVGMDTDSDSESDTTDEDKRKTFTADKKMPRTGRRRLLGGRKHSKDIEEGPEDSESAKEADPVPGLVALPTGFASASASDSGHSHNVESEKTVQHDDEEEVNEAKVESEKKSAALGAKKTKLSGFQLPKVASAMASMSLLEQDMPADAVLAKAGAAEFLQGYDPAVMPLGIITLEDVLEELIGEEIYDEFDDMGAHGDPYEVPPAPVVPTVTTEQEAVEGGPSGVTHGNSSSRRSSFTQRSTTSGGNQSHAPKASTLSVTKPGALKGLGFFRARSAPPVPRDMAEHEGHGEGEKTVHINEGMNTEVLPGPIPNASVPSGGAPGSASILMPRPVRGTGRHPPSVILEQHSSVSSSDSGRGVSALAHAPQELPTPAPVLAAPVPRPAVVGLSASVGGAPTSKASVHTASPAPSPALEAILLDRKRRLHAAGTGVAAAGPVAPAPSTGGAAASAGSPVLLGAVAATLGVATASFTVGREAAPTSTFTVGREPAAAANAAAPPLVPAPSTGSVGGKTVASAVKGTRFKSSPLGGAERAGVVVAEQVNAAYAQGTEENKDEAPEYVA